MASSASIFEGLSLPPTFDAHVHLRDGDMMKTVVPTIRQGGCSTVWVMPNLIPPLTTVSAVLDYKSRLQTLAPDVEFLMTLYLHPSLTPETIEEAARAGIRGVKAYPAGVTTNSSEGVVDWETFYPLFSRMQEVGMVLNLHGEVPFSKDYAAEEEPVSVLNAEPRFLPTLHKIHAAFPQLRIVLEHCTTAAALQAVAKCGPTVAATVTAHHLWITTDDVVGDPFLFCKPVAKSQWDRIALLRAAVGEKGEELRGRVFFGSDSAPHPLTSKTPPAPGKKAPAGCFTQPYASQLVLAAIDDAIRQEWLVSSRDPTKLLREVEGFLGGYGRRFYGLSSPADTQRIKLERWGRTIPDVMGTMDGEVKVACFGAGKEVLSLGWTDQ